MAQVILHPARTQIQIIQKAIHDQQRALNQQSPIDHVAIARINNAIKALGKEFDPINNASLEEEFALLAEDFETLKIRIRILAQRNRVSTQDAILNRGGTQPMLGSIGSFLHIPAASFLRANTHCHNAKTPAIKNQLRVLRRMHVDDLNRYANSLDVPGNWKHILDLSPNIQAFNFSPKPGKNALSKAKIFTILQMLPPSVTELNFRNTKINDQILSWVANRFSGLTALVLDNCTKINNSSLIEVGKNCPQLSRLSINRCGNLSAQCLVPFSNLRELELADSMIHLQDALSICSALTHLSASWSEIDTNSWTALAAHGTHIGYLNLNGILYNHKECLPALRKCPQLSHLSLQSLIGSFSSFHIRQLVCACPQLQSLDVRYSLKDMSPCVAWATFAECCPKIKELEMAVRLERASDATLRKFMAVYPKVRGLSLAKADHLTDAGLTELATKYNRGLAEIFLHRAAITDHGLSELARLCPCLTTLKLTRCNVTFAGLKNLLELCGDLKTVVLWHVPLTPAEQTILKNSFSHIDITVN